MRLQVLTARALWLMGQFDDMARRTRWALSHSGMSRPLRSQLLAAQALALSRLGPMETAEATSQEALLVGRALGDVATTSLALHALGEVAKNEGRHLAAHAYFHELRTLTGPAHLAEEVAALQFIDCFDEAEDCWPTPNGGPRPTTPPTCRPSRAPDCGRTSSGRTSTLRPPTPGR